MTHVIIFICLCVCVHLAGRAGLCVCACVCLCDDYPWFVLCLLSMVWNLFNINCLNCFSHPGLELCLIGYSWPVLIVYYELNFLESSIKIEFLYLTCLFVACCLKLLPSELFRIVIS